MKYPSELSTLWGAVRSRSVLFVDPGVQGTGLAYWRRLTVAVPDQTQAILPASAGGDWMYRAASVTAIFRKFLREHNPSAVVIEDQAVFSGAKGYAAAAGTDLMRLAQIAGALAAVAFLRHPRLPRVYWLSVGAWKGQLPKEVVYTRIQKRLGVTYPNHVADAVGMGLAVAGGKTL